VGFASAMVLLVSLAGAPVIDRDIIGMKGNHD
jgi:hypothetical protein